MKKYFILIILAAGTVFAGEPSDYVSFEKKGREVDNFISRTWTKIGWSFSESSRYFIRFRKTAENKAKKVRDKAGEGVRSKVKELDQATDRAEKLLHSKIPDTSKKIPDREK